MNRQVKRKLVRAVLVGVPAFVLGQVAHGQTAYDWTNGNGDGLWPQNNSWNPTTGYPGSANPSITTDTATFGDTAPSGGTVSLGGDNLTILNLNFTAANNSYNVGVTAGDTITLATTGGVNFGTASSTQVASQTVSANLALTGPGMTIANLTPVAVTNYSTLDFAGVISGTSSVTFESGATSATAKNSIFEFDGQNTYSGGTISPGSLNSNAIIAVGSSSVFAGTAVTSGPLGTGTVSINNNPTFTPINGDQTIGNQFQINTGIQFGSPTVASFGSNYAHNLTLAGPLVLNSSTTDRTFSADLQGNILFVGLAGTSASTFNISASKGDAGSLTISTPAGAAMVINDSIVSTKVTGVAYQNLTSTTNFGNVVLDDAGSTYNGTTTLNATTGTLQIGVSSTGLPGAVTSGPFGMGTLAFNGAGTLQVQPINGNQTVANALTLTAHGYFVGSAAGSNATNTLTFSGAATAGAVINTNDMVSGAALYLGLMGSNASTLNLGANTLTFQSHSTDPAGGVTVINDIIAGTGGSLTLQSASGAVNEYGTTYINNASNTYTGGTLVVGKGTSAAALGSGAILAGTGLVGASGFVTIGGTTSGSNVGGIISPGAANANSTAGTINVPSMRLFPYGRYIFNYNAGDQTVGGGINDLISGSGTLDLSNLSSAPFDLDLVSIGGTPSGGTATYAIADFAGGVGINNGNAITSDFTFSGDGTNAANAGMETVTVASDGTANGQELLLNFTPAGTPEPGSLLVLAAGFGALNMRRRRKAKPEDHQA